MEHTVAVLFRNSLAHYTVVTKDDAGYEANLLKYCGNSNDEPPAHVSFIKDGRHCSGDTENWELMDDLFHAIQR
jgi:hypothetical protein